MVALFKSFLVVVFLLGSVSSSQAQTIRAVAPVFAPLQMKKNGKPSGYAVETVNEILKRLKEKDEIDKYTLRILAWKRAMVITQKTVNTLFFSISRTPQREKLFHWVGEISPYEVYLFKLKKNKDIKVTSLEDIQKADYRIGVQNGSNAVQLLEKNDFVVGRDYLTYSHYSKGVPMLFKNRFAMMPLTKFVARTNVCKLGYSGDNIEPVLRLNEISKPLWLVFNKETPLDLVDKVRTEFNKLKAEGFIKATQQRYLKAWENQPCTKEN